MNRSVLLVICDFFILTLLSFVQFDGPSTTPTAEAEPTLQREVSAPAMSNMLATLEIALESERQRRDVLTNALAAQTAELEERMRLLAEREQRLSNVQERLSVSEAEAKRLAEERARLERSQGEARASVEALHRAFEVTQRSTDTLQERLTDSTREAAEAKARMEALERELAQRQAEAADMQKQIAELDKARAAISQEKQDLVVELRTTEVAAQYARREVTNLNQQLSVATQEKAGLIQAASQLATNVGTLSQQSTAIRDEITRQTEQAGAIRQELAKQTEQSTAIRDTIERTTRFPANTIYGTFLSNRVSTFVIGTTRGAFGQEVVRRRQGGTVFVRSGNTQYALLHVDSTPLRIWPPDASWSGFNVTLSRSDVQVDAPELALLERDPRIVAIPVDASVPASLGVAVYDPVTDPAEFAEAVIIGGEESYYGECNFRLKADAPGYVEMERSSFRRLFGEFAPRRGDLAFTKTGMFLGILVNSDHCLLLTDFTTLPPFRCGERLDPAANSAVLRTAHATLQSQPSALR